MAFGPIIVGGCVQLTSGCVALSLCIGNNSNPCDIACAAIIAVHSGFPPTGWTVVGNQFTTSGYVSMDVVASPTCDLFVNIGGQVWQLDNLWATQGYQAPFGSSITTGSMTSIPSFCPPTDADNATGQKWIDAGASVPYYVTAVREYGVAVPDVDTTKDLLFDLQNFTLNHATVTIGFDVATITLTPVRTISNRMAYDFIDNVWYLKNVDTSSGFVAVPMALNGTNQWYLDNVSATNKGTSFSRVRTGGLVPQTSSTFQFCSSLAQYRRWFGTSLLGSLDIIATSDADGSGVVFNGPIHMQVGYAP